MEPRPAALVDHSLTFLRRYISIRTRYPPYAVTELPVRTRAFDVDAKFNQSLRQRAQGNGIRPVAFGNATFLHHRVADRGARRVAVVRIAALVPDAIDGHIPGWTGA